MKFMEQKVNKIEGLNSVVTKKAATAIFFCVLGQIASAIFPAWPLAESKFLEETSFLWKVLYYNVSLIGWRCTYHFAWLLGETINNAAGFGWNESSGEWDLITNTRPLACETASNPQIQMRNWNIQTTYWLRHVVYERAPKKYATAMTFGLSALWHGFFPGYYFLFTFAHFITVAHRKIQK